MADEQDYVSEVKKAFGRKTITDVHDLDSVEAEMDRAIETGSAYHETEFDRSLRVDVKNIRQSPARYETLQADVKQNLVASFKRFKNMIVEQNSANRNTIKQQNEGVVGETPFMCFAEIDSSGKLVSTIVVTDKATSKTTQKEDGTYRYEEHRMGPKGPETIVSDGKTTQHFIGNMTKAEMMEMEVLGNAMERQMGKNPIMDPATLEAYLKKAEELGITLDIDVDDREKYSSPGMMRRKDGKLTGMLSAYDKEKGYSDGPECIVIAEEKNGQMVNRTYRKTNTGLYMDCDSFNVESGEPQFDMLSYEEIKLKAAEMNIDIDYFDKFEKFKEENKSELPEAAISINQDVHNQIERQKQREAQQEQEEELDENNPPMSL